MQDKTLRIICEVNTRWQIFNMYLPEDIYAELRVLTNTHAQYLKKVKRPSNPPKKHQALIAVGLKVMRIMFYMAKNKEKYDFKKALRETRIKQIQKLLAA